MCTDASAQPACYVMGNKWESTQQAMEQGSVATGTWQEQGRLEQGRAAGDRYDLKGGLHAAKRQANPLCGAKAPLTALACQLSTGSSLGATAGSCGFGQRHHLGLLHLSSKRTDVIG